MRRWLERATPLVVWTAFAVLFSSALRLVLHYGREIPWRDDFHVIPLLVGREPLTFSNLWAQHSEHRIFLPRLAYWVTFHLGGRSFRASEAIHLSIFALAVAWLVVVAREIRGRYSIADLAFPLLLLHFGHAENFLCGFQIAFILPSALFLVAIGILATWTGTSAWRARALAACIAVLPLTGLHGVALALPLAVWGIGTGWTELHGYEPARRRAGAIVLVGGSAAIAIAALGFVGLVFGVGPAPDAARARTAIHFLGMALGPVSVWIGSACGIGVALVGIATVVALGRAARAEGPARAPSLGLASAIVAVAAVAIAVALGRAHHGPGAGDAPRYGLLAAPLLVAAYLAATRGRRVWTEWLIFAAALAAFAWNTRKGTELGAGRAHEADVFDRAAQADPPLQELDAVRKEIFPWEPAAFAEAMNAMRDAKIGPFRMGPFAWSTRQRKKNRALFPMFHTPPDRFRTAQPLRALGCFGRPDVLVHPPAELRYRLPRGVFHLTGFFGVCDAAFTGRRATDGVTFEIVRAHPGAAEHVVFARPLRPLTSPDDRGLQHFDVTVRVDSLEDLFLRTTPGPAADPRWDWIVLTGIAVHPAERATARSR